MLDVEELDALMILSKALQSARDYPIVIDSAFFRFRRSDKGNHHDYEEKTRKKQAMDIYPEKQCTMIL
uniref:Uncharacterized protein n=1 Tax=Megaselia scalaris TaxID=36166 RepID=T1GJT2_MEGSC